MGYVVIRQVPGVELMSRTRELLSSGSFHVPGRTLAKEK